jgi:hypothetical protein
MKKTKTQKFIVLNELVNNQFVKSVKKVKNLSAVISKKMELKLLLIKFMVILYTLKIV